MSDLKQIQAKENRERETKPFGVTGELSPEEIAFRLTQWIGKIEARDGGNFGRKEIIESFAECLLAVKDPKSVLGKKKAWFF